MGTVCSGKHGGWLPAPTPLIDHLATLVCRSSTALFQSAGVGAVPTCRSKPPSPNWRWHLPTEEDKCRFESCWGHSLVVKSGHHVALIRRSSQFKSGRADQGLVVYWRSIALCRRAGAGSIPVGTALRGGQVRFLPCERHGSWEKSRVGPAPLTFRGGSRLTASTPPCGGGNEISILSYHPTPT